MNTINALKLWPQNHSVLFALLLFVLGCVVSIYAATIRRFISLPPQRLNVRLLRTRLEGLQSELAQLIASKDNVYELARRVILPVVASMYLLGVLSLLTYLTTLDIMLAVHGNISANQFTERDRSVGGILGAFVMILAVSRLVKAATLIKRLGKYEKSRSELEEQIVIVERRLREYDRTEPEVRER